MLQFNSQRRDETTLEAGTRPTWKFVHAKERHVFVIARRLDSASGCIPEFPTDGPADSAAGHALAFDTTNPGRWDTGLVELLGMRSAATTSGLAIDATALPESARKLLSLLPEELAKTEPPSWQAFRPLHWLGGKTDFSHRPVSAPLTYWPTSATPGPAALVIVGMGLGNFLIGAILAFVGALQLRKFAAYIFVANLVGLAVVREMAAVMTTIVMAGRTGGAYAARIATMRGNEELDALKVVGIPFADDIVLPSILALAFAMPILYIYGC